MCTVTHLPTSTGFLLTHNRDEAPARTTASIFREKMPRDTLLFPRDAKAGGAWIAAARSGKVACLLNGAFVKHRHEPPYRRSRGLMLLDFFGFDRAEDFFEKYDFEGIEPFTFLFFSNQKVVELRWDGLEKHVKNLPPDQPHFWCSATLYPDEMAEKRRLVFQQWLENQGPARAERLPRAILDLHRRGSVGDPENDFVMNRADRVRTVSITQVAFAEGIFLKMKYLDLLGGGRDERRMTPFDFSVQIT